MVTAYGRDRGGGVNISSFSTKKQARQFAAEMWCEYIYFYKDGKWTHSRV